MIGYLDILLYFFPQIDVVTQRGFVPVDERMRVLDANGNLVCFKSFMYALFFLGLTHFY